MGDEVENNEAKNPSAFKKISGKINQDIVEAINKEILEMEEVGNDLMNEIDNELELLQRDLDIYRALKFYFIKNHLSEFDSFSLIHKLANDISDRLQKSNHNFRAQEDLINQGIYEISSKLTPEEKKVLEQGKALEVKIEEKKNFVAQLQTKWNTAITSAINTEPKAQRPENTLNG